MRMRQSKVKSLDQADESSHMRVTTEAFKEAI